MGRTGLKLALKEPTIFFKELKLGLTVLLKNKNHTKPVYRTWYPGNSVVEGFSQWTVHGRVLGHIIQVL